MVWQEQDEWKVEDYGDLNFADLKALANHADATHGTAKRAELVGQATQVRRKKASFDSGYQEQRSPH